MIDVLQLNRGGAADEVKRRKGRPAPPKFASSVFFIGGLRFCCEETSAPLRALAGSSLALAPTTAWAEVQGETNRPMFGIDAAAAPSATAVGRRKLAVASLEE